MLKTLLILILIFFVWSLFIEPNLIIIKKYKLKIFDKKIVFISDLHISKFGKKRLKRIVKLINEQNPDLVLSGGDYIHGHSGETTLEIEKIAKELSDIKAPIISVLGNHDGWYDKYRVKKALENNGIKVLLNSSTELEGISIAGTEDLQTGIPNIKTALEKTSSPCILLTHTPDIYDDVKESVNLILAGHLHGGQVRLPWYGAILLPSNFGKKFEYGLYDYNGNKMIVTKGLGTSIFTMRFNCIPEIVVIE